MEDNDINDASGRKYKAIIYAFSDTIRSGFFGL